MNKFVRAFPRRISLTRGDIRDNEYLLSSKYYQSNANCPFTAFTNSVVLA